MPGKPPDFQVTLKDKEGKLHNVAAAWKQDKGHFTGTLKVTDDLVKLLQERQEMPLIIFPNKPKAKKPAAEQQTPAA